MAVKLSPVFNDAQFDSSGNPYTGAQIFTYASGSTTPQTTYQDSGALSQHTNPIILNSRGEPPAPIWLTEGLTYKLYLTTPTDTNPPVTSVRVIDNVSGINDTTSAQDEWVASGSTPTYIGATSFSVSGDQTSTYTIGRRLKSTNSGGTVYSGVSASSFGGGITTVTVVNDSGTLDSGLSAVSLGILRADHSSIPHTKSSSTGLKSVLTDILDINGNETLKLSGVASAVNELTATNAATGNPAILSATGETNVSIDVRPKGTGTVRITDGADVTKKMSFNVSAVTSAKTRTATVPDSNFALGFPKGHLFGFTLSNNAGDATNDIDITAGQCKDSTGAVDMVCAAMTKQLDAGWAPGSAAGFRNSGVAIANTTYHVYAVTKDDGTQDYYAHTSTTVATVITALQAESGGSSYLYARRIGSILRSGGSITAFVQDGDHFQLSNAALDINVNTAGTSAVTRTLASIPTGINVRAILHVQVRSDGSNDAVYLSDLATTDVACSIAGTGGSPQVGAINSSGSNDGYGEVVVRTNTSAQIRTRNLAGADANDILRIVTVGWYDTRGRLA